MFPGVKLLLPASNQIAMEIPKFSVPPELLGFPHRRGLSIAELAKSSGFPGQSTEVYATSATNFP
ncbi:MAG: hypothetical protein DWH78_10055 [Planctomycetota bacterium]|nr:MAG: hypothetical protein DWH78_10055 [Planctomycetota bacterium]